MTDTSAGLTRLTITEHHYDPMYKQKAFDIYVATEADALLADLRGKLEATKRENKELCDLADTHDADYTAMEANFRTERRILKQQLEAERAKVRELERDAGRYRWLRERGVTWNGDTAAFWLVDSIADYEIDAAIAATQANEGGKDG
jgi:hypothetical protein